MKKTIGVFLVIGLMLISTALAQGLSIQLKRTNPGIAKEKSAEIIFDIVNTDFTHKIEGFLWCRSPDDAVVSSTLGAGTGSGAQYVSPKFIMDVGPSQKAISLTIEADSPGDKRAGCTVKYSPFKESAGQTTTTEEDVSYDGTIGKTDFDISGFKVKLVSYSTAVEAVEATEETEAVEAQPATTTISVDNVPKEIEIGKSATIGALTIEVTAATAESADVKITGKKTTTTGEAVQRSYLKMNGQYVSSLTDDQYREIRLDKTIPFVRAGIKEPACPEGQASCKAGEVIDLKAAPGGIPIWVYIVAIVVILVLVIYLIGKTARRD